jgi:hypothetical protein
MLICLIDIGFIVYHLISCRGEMTAAALENNLSAIEGKVDELLAVFERQSAALGTTAETRHIENNISGTGQDQMEQSNSPPK